MHQSIDTFRHKFKLMDASVHLFTLCRCVFCIAVVIFMPLTTALMVFSVS